MGNIPSDIKLPALLYFSSPHCGVCRYTTPLVEEAKKDPYYGEITFIDNQYEKEFNVRFSPTFVFITKDGVVTTYYGYENERSFGYKLNKLLHPETE